METNPPASNPSPPDTVEVPRAALIKAVKLLNFSHQQGLFSKFSVKEAMEHLSAVVFLDSLLTEDD